MIFLIVGGCIVFIFVVLILFSFPQFSPIPYFPSNDYDMALILKSLQLKNNQIVIDLGAGDGKIIFEAAGYAYRKNLNVTFVAVDINPVLILIMNLRNLVHPNKKNIKILWGDMFKLDYKLLSTNFRLPTFYLYISPRFLEPVTKKIKKLAHSSIVSYMYSIPSLRRHEKKVNGKNKIYIYNEI